MQEFSEEAAKAPKETASGLSAEIKQKLAEQELAIAELTAEDPDGTTAASLPRDDQSDEPGDDILADPLIYRIARLRQKCEIRGSLGPADWNAFWGEVGLEDWQTLRERLPAL